VTEDLQRDGYVVSADRSRLDLAVIYGFLHSAYWCAGIPKATVARAIEGSLPFGAYKNDQQVGFARVVTDYATFAYLADVFVLPEHRGRGVSKLLMEAINSHPRLQDLRTWMLKTRDAHGLYRQFGFAPTTSPERVMERTIPDLYKR